MSELSYSIDTNAILTAWDLNYRPKNFGGFWKKLEALIAAGRAFATEEVIRELSKKDDEAYEWARGQSGFSVPLENEQIAIVQGLAKDYPVLAKERLGRMRADGFVIGLALWKSLTVVTAENHRGPEKIPNLCAAVGVTCITLADLISNENWNF